MGCLVVPLKQPLHASELHPGAVLSIGRLDYRCNGLPFCPCVAAFRTIRENFPDMKQSAIVLGVLTPCRSFAAVAFELSVLMWTN